MFTFNCTPTVHLFISSVQGNAWSFQVKTLSVAFQVSATIQAPYHCIAAENRHEMQPMEALTAAEAVVFRLPTLCAPFARVQELWRAAATLVGFLVADSTSARALTIRACARIVSGHGPLRSFLHSKSRRGCEPEFGSSPAARNWPRDRKRFPRSASRWRLKKRKLQTVVSKSPGKLIEKGFNWFLFISCSHVAMLGDNG